MTLYRGMTVIKRHRPDKHFAGPCLVTVRLKEAQQMGMQSKQFLAALVGEASNPDTAEDRFVALLLCPNGSLEVIPRDTLLQLSTDWLTRVRPAVPSKMYDEQSVQDEKGRCLQLLKEPHSLLTAQELVDATKATREAIDGSDNEQPAEPRGASRSGRDGRMSPSRSRGRSAHRRDKAGTSRGRKSSRKRAQSPKLLLHQRQVSPRWDHACAALLCCCTRCP
jgi:hypothetical protein